MRIILIQCYLAYNVNYSIMNSYDKCWDYKFLYCKQKNVPTHCLYIGIKITLKKPKQFLQNPHSSQ